MDLFWSGPVGQLLIQIAAGLAVAALVYALGFQRARRASDDRNPAPAVDAGPGKKNDAEQRRPSASRAVEGILLSLIYSAFVGWTSYSYARNSRWVDYATYFVETPTPGVA